MAVNMGQAAIAGTVQAFVIPPGPCSVAVWSGAATTLYLGTSKNLTASNGFAVPTSPVSFSAFPGSAGETVWGLNTAATTLAVNFIVQLGTVRSRMPRVQPTPGCAGIADGNMEAVR